MVKLLNYFIRFYSQIYSIAFYTPVLLNNYQIEDKSHLEKKIQLLKIEYEGQIDTTNQKLTELSAALSKENREIEDKELQMNTLRGEIAGTINYCDITLIKINTFVIVDGSQ